MVRSRLADTEPPLRYKLLIVGKCSIGKTVCYCLSEMKQTAYT